MSATIIEHQGSTSLLSKSLEEGGKRFPFRFHAVTPEEQSWAYRLLLPDKPGQLREEELIQLLAPGGTPLRADWEEQVGHPVGLLTIYLPPKDGTSGRRSAKYERGPDLDMQMPQTSPPEPPVPEVKPRQPKRDEIDLDIF